MVLRILSTTILQGLQPAMCFSNSSHTAGSTVPSTYSFKYFSNSSHFMACRSSTTEPRLKKKLQGEVRKRLPLEQLSAYGRASVLRAEQGRPGCGSAVPEVADVRGAAAPWYWLRLSPRPRRFP